MTIRPAVAGVLLCATAAVGQTIYNAAPDWTSSDTLRGTGAALVDLDRDGYLDLVVSNGNDMDQQPLTVYYNQGDGTLPSTPGWQSDDWQYNGHLEVSDVNGDGWPDVAVAHLGDNSTLAPVARLYLNQAGTLSALPEWNAQLDGNAFDLSFGDMNNDGRPDLAVGTGWPYGVGRAEHNLVYLNSNGILSSTPSWQSDDLNHCMCVLWTDADDDGWMDLVGVAADSDTWIYRNLGGVLETTASWRTTDNDAQFAMMATVGDVDGDGLRDLFVTDNTQMFGGSGHFRQYSGLPGGFFTQTPTWSYYSASQKYGSAVALADVDADGDLDLATGAWWGGSLLFLNDGAGFGPAPDWQPAPSSVIEKLVFGDLDNHALRREVDTFSPTAGVRLFHLDNRHLQAVLAVRVDGVELNPDEYAISREHGWLTLASEPAVGLEVDYLYSHSLDLVVTNWDANKGNYIYYNLAVANFDCDRDDKVDLVDYACFSDCLGGPGVVADPQECGLFDTDLDRDVDLKDFAALAQTFVELLSK